MLSEGDFRLCGYWEKPAATIVNQIYVSKEFQDSFSPVWKDRTDKDRFTRVNSYAGSINLGFNFGSAYDLSGQMEKLKERLKWGDDINDGVNWAYAASSVDPTSVAIVGILFVMIVTSGYLIIYNIFHIAVSSDIRYYGLLKTIGTTDRQLKRIVIRQAVMLSLAAIPAGMLLGFLISVVLLPIITGSIFEDPCRIYPDIRIFAASAFFSWSVVRVSCIRPCKVIKKVSPVEEAKMDAVEEAVSEYCDVTRPQLGYKSRMIYLKDFEKIVDMFLLVGGVLSFVLALIGILNLVNLSFTSINERKNELGVLRAVGMTRKQMVQMLVGEGMIRICLAFAFVLTVGLLINYLIVKLVAGQMIMFSYQFVCWPIFVCIPVFTLISAAVSKIAVRQSLFAKKIV